MTDRIERLQTLLRLRGQDVERRREALGRAMQAVVAAELARDRAEAALERADERHEAALADRLKAPCDPLVTLYCQSAETARRDAAALLSEAEASLKSALGDAADRRRKLLRAQAKFDAMKAHVATAVAQHRRAQERRRADEGSGVFRPALTAFA